MPSSYSFIILVSSSSGLGIGSQSIMPYFYSSTCSSLLYNYLLLESGFLEGSLRVYRVLIYSFIHSHHQHLNTEQLRNLQTQIRMCLIPTRLTYKSCLSSKEIRIYFQ